jgi:hypothetical protein
MKGATQALLFKLSHIMGRPVTVRAEDREAIGAHLARMERSGLVINEGLLSELWESTDSMYSVVVRQTPGFDDLDELLARIVTEHTGL